MLEEQAKVERETMLDGLNLLVYISHKLEGFTIIENEQHRSHFKRPDFYLQIP